MRPVRFLLGIAAATGVGLGFASPAYAAEPTPTPTATATSTATGTPRPATPTPPAGTPAPTGSAVPAPAGEDSPPRDEDLPGLAVTGAQVGGMVVLGSGLLSAGVALVAVRRRRLLPDLLDGAAD